MPLPAMLVCCHGIVVDTFARIALQRGYGPVTAGDRGMDVYLRLLAERADDALAAHDLARIASQAERAKAVTPVSRS